MNATIELDLRELTRALLAGMEEKAGAPAGAYRGGDLRIVYDHSHDGDCRAVGATLELRRGGPQMGERNVYGLFLGVHRGEPRTRVYAWRAGRRRPGERVLAAWATLGGPGHDEFGAGTIGPIARKGLKRVHADALCRTLRDTLEGFLLEAETPAIDIFNGNVEVTCVPE